MICSKCGKEIKDDAMFCNYCGAKTTENTTKKANIKIIIPIIAIICVMAIGFTIMYVSHLGNSNSSTKQAFGSVYADLSEVISYMKKSWDLDYEELAWCRFYEVTDPENDGIIVQYKETEADDFKYALFAYDVDLEHFYEYRIHDDELPVKCSVMAQEKIGNNEMTALSDFGSSEGIYVICDEQGYIVRAAMAYWGGENEWSIFDYDYDKNHNVICRTEYVVPYTIIRNMDYKEKPEGISKFSYDNNGNLTEWLEFEGTEEDYYQITTFSYGKDGYRDCTKTVIYGEDEMTLNFERDEDGFVISAFVESKEQNQIYEYDYQIVYLQNGLQKILQ